MLKQNRLCLIIIQICCFIIFIYADTIPDNKSDTLVDSTKNLDIEKYQNTDAGKDKEHTQDSIQSEKLTKKQEREQRRTERKKYNKLTKSAHESMLVGSSKHKHGFTGRKKYTGKGPLKPQTFCPVMGGPIDKRFYAVHDGMRVYFCCEGCIYQFKQTPNLYIKKLKRYGEKPEKLK